MALLFRKQPTLSMILGLVITSFGNAQDNPRTEYLNFVRTQANDLRRNDSPPGSLKEWEARKESLRRQLLNAWGGFPDHPCPLNPQKLGEIKRDGYTVERLIFQTFPGVWMTANAYVPEGTGRRPAILVVHGHWRMGKVEPTVQMRCIGAVKLGYFVLVVDAFGAGERGVGKALGEYHGEFTAATLFPVGRPLSGLQVYENMRAVDYLLTRPEVDPQRIGITGASGGGNQSMYAGGWDDRHRAVVPVCSVGNYRAYLGVACCMCEVVPGALRFTEEGDVLGLAAPRALMVVSATQDGVQFSVPEAKKSLARAEAIYQLYDRPLNVRHTIVEGSHGYSQPMREAMYGWMTFHLKGEGDAKPIPEPKIQTEDPQTLRCFPNDSRPDDYVTIPRFAAREAKRLLDHLNKVQASLSAEALQADLQKRREALVKEIFGGFPDIKPKMGLWVKRGTVNTTTIEPEPGLALQFSSRTDANVSRKEDQPFYLILSLDGPDSPSRQGLERAALAQGGVALTYELRATGRLEPERNRVGKAPDHNVAQWALWIGRPLLGQWVFDIRQLLDAHENAGTLPKNLIVIGEGPAGVVALAAAAVDPRIKKVAAVNTLASYVTDVPYVNQRMGIIPPGILKYVGDIPHLAAMAHAKTVLIAGGVRGDGMTLTDEELQTVYQPAREIAQKLGTRVPILQTETAPETVIAALK